MDIFLDRNSPLHGWGLLLLAAAMLTFIAGTTGKYFRKPAILPRQPPIPSKPQKGKQEDAYYAIEPLPTLDISTEEPIKARPFKPKYHMTMALENSTISDLLTMDNTYIPRLTLRRHLLTTHPSETIASNPTATPAVLELYTWLTHTYLPLHFPTIFTLTSTNLKNTCTGDTLPLTPSSATEALHLLGAHIDTEFLLLLPSPQAEDEGKYRLEAFVTCFPSGFRTRDKLGLLLADIHAPVPHYRQKLERSMDRFFAALGVGRVVKRWNWTISTSGELYCVKGNHATKEEAEAGLGDEKVDLRTTVLRCERQTLHRLPESGALVFAFKTYQYPMRELRDEGSGEALCEAIDGMATGSAPEMRVYKRQVVWGEKVKAFLRGEIGEDD